MKGDFMDINLKNEKEILIQKIKQLNQEICLIENFVIKNSDYYKSEKSLLAIKQIKTIWNNKIIQERELLEELDKLKLQIESSCNHEIIISDKYNTFCALCKSLIIDIPSTSKLLIETPNDRYFKLVNDIINQGENKIVDYTIEQLEELQYSNDIKIKRLRK